MYISLIAAVYIGFAVADGRTKVVGATALRVTTGAPFGTSGAERRDARVAIVAEGCNKIVPTPDYRA
jgi:hypothetical protein